jgi:superfamily II DNA or RNA helicase
MTLTKTTSFKHQAEIIERSKDARYFGLFMEQGTGKSHVIIATFTHLFRTGKINGVLILAPNGVHDNWVRNEIPTHCALSPDEVILACWHGSDSTRKKRFFEYACTADHGLNGPAENKLVILVANIEAVRTTAFSELLAEFIQRNKFLLVVDESTIIKNPKADQTKAVFKIAKNASYSRILTGTPITQSPLDLWAQCRVLSEDALPYPSFTAFKGMFRSGNAHANGQNAPSTKSWDTKTKPSFLRLLHRSRLAS